MKTLDMRRDVARPWPAGWSGSGWTDSSWELAQGLDVIEDLQLDDWPAEWPVPSSLHAPCGQDN